MWLIIGIILVTIISISSMLIASLIWNKEMWKLIQRRDDDANDK